MLAAHEILAFLVVGVPALAALVGGLVYWRRRGAGRLLANLLALAQTLLVAQVGLGLLLLSDDRKAGDELHYVYGSLSLGAILVPWMYAPAQGPKRLLWFAGTSLLAAALAVRAFMTGTGMRRFFSEHTAIRGFLIIGLIALVVVVLSLEPVLATVGGLLKIAFFLAIAFFLFLMWRERRSDIEAWNDRSRNVFYAAIVLAVVDIGAFIGLSPSGPDALAFFLVLGACAYAVVRIWREEHRYS